MAVCSIPAVSDLPTDVSALQGYTVDGAMLSSLEQEQTVALSQADFDTVHPSVDKEKDQVRVSTGDPT